MTVVIVDYGMGNLFSVKKMLDKLSVKNLISRAPQDILQAERIILPGVGSFKSAMENLHAYDLIAPLNEAVQKNKTPFLGICLGMQLMAQFSHEGGEKTPGLGWLNASIEHLDKKENYRIPHVGWNNIEILNSHFLFKSFLKNPTFYFTHSYILKNISVDHLLATCDYSSSFPAAIIANHLFGTQFHPEKSQLNGKILMENFLNWRP